MAAPATSQPGEHVWNTYQDIQTVVVKGYKLTDPLEVFRHERVSQALQRLGQAVLLRHQLQDKRPIVTRWTITLEKAKIQQMPLSTTQEMISAKIPEWEEAWPGIPATMIGHDSWDDGVPARPAGYREKPSLQEVLRCEYSELKVIVNTTPEQAWSLFERIQKVVSEELTQSLPKDKETEIQKALARLGQAVSHKYNIPAEAAEIVPQIDLKQVDRIDLYTPDTMLDAKCREKESANEPRRSLREALNLPTDGFSTLFGLETPLFGKSATLENVEKKLI
jgi:hypothetical protein